MSVCIQVRTEKKLTPDLIFDQLVEQGEAIMVCSNGFPCLRLGTINQAVRGVEISEEDNGYEVRVCIFANKSDWRLCRVILKTLVQLSGGKLYYEDDDDEPILDVDMFFNDEYVEDQIEQNFSVTAAMIKANDSLSVYNLYQRQVCLGSKYYQRLGIALDDNPCQAMDILQEDICKSLWCDNLEHGTPDNMCIVNSNAQSQDQDDEAKRKNISMYYYANDAETPNDCDYVSFAPLFGIYDEENNDCTLIPYSDLHKIVPPSWTLIDNEQYKLAPLSRTDFDAFKKRAMQYVKNDYFEE